MLFLDIINAVSGYTYGKLSAVIVVGREWCVTTEPTNGQEMYFIIPSL